jgi:hypothetical protein
MANLGLNPWKSILTKPRETIRSIVGYNANYRLLVLSIIYGFNSMLGIAQKISFGERLSGISMIILAVIL